MNQDQENCQFNNASWDAFEHPWKSHFSLNDKNEIVLVGNALRTEKVLPSLQPSNWDTTVQELQSAFEKVTSIAKELQEKWEVTEDKVSLRLVVQQAKKNIKQLAALGDYSPFIQQMDQYTIAINEQLSNNISRRKALIEEAKSLSGSEEWSETTEKFKQIIDQWKQAPEVSKPDYEQLWNELSQAKDAFFEKKRLHYENLEKEQMINWDRKLELCEKAEALQHSTDWKHTTEQFNALMEEWKTIGIVPSAEKNEALWDKFNTARKTFFDRKHEHSAQIKAEQEQNLQLKTALLEQAEGLANSTDWKETSQMLEALQKEWEAIGKVPIEHTDNLWTRWKQARDTFYEAKRNNAKAYRNTLQENYERKATLVERAEHLSKSERWKQTTDELVEMMTEWKTIGPIPKEYGDELWNRFNEARRLFFKRKDEDRDKRKAQFEERAKSRLSQTKQFLQTLESEQKDEQEQLLEFKQSLENIHSDAKKDLELKAHLGQLINKLDKSIAKRVDKIAEVQAQLKSLE